jgi:hypothetical protein
MDTPKGDKQQQFQGYRYADDPHVQVAGNYLAHIQRNFESIFHVVPMTEHQRDVLHKVVNAIQASQLERYETKWPFPAPKDTSGQRSAQVTETQALADAVPRVVDWIIDACSSLSGALPAHEIMDALTAYNESGIFAREYNPRN